MVKTRAPPRLGSHYLYHQHVVAANPCAHVVCILYLVPCILCPVSCIRILYPVFSILCSVSCYPVHCTLYPGPCTLYHVFSILYPVLSTLCFMYCVEFRTASGTGASAGGYQTCSCPASPATSPASPGTSSTLSLLSTWPPLKASGEQP